jgi:hypothetical protein
VTTWVENPQGGRDRGPRGLARAWVEVLVRPRRFFRVGVAPGDQAPGLAFAVVIALAYASVWLASVPARIPALGAGPVGSGLLTLLAVALLIAPAILHLVAALQTVVLLVVETTAGFAGLSRSDRGGVSETVQVIAYATAPCVLAAVPNPAVGALATLYGAALLVIGIAEVHDMSYPRATITAAVPATLVFGYAFAGVPAIAELLRAWAIV